MIFLLYFIYPLLLLCIHTAAQSTSVDDKPEQLYRFPNKTSIEDVLVLRNGSLLLALSTEPSLYRLNPKYPRAPVLVKRFPGQTSLLSITQLNNTVIAVVAGNTTLSADSVYSTAVSGSYVVYLLSICDAKIVASFPILQASRLESVTTLPDKPQYLLISDPILDVVWRLDTYSGVVDKAITDFGLGGAAGVDGIEVAGQYLYFVAQSQASVARLRITPDGRSKGEPAQSQFFTPRFVALDDLAIGPNGTIFFTDRYFDQLAFAKSQEQGSFLDSEDGLEHPTAIAFAGNILYVVTAGYLPAVDGTGAVVGTGGGQVLRIDLARTSEFGPTGSGILSSSSSGVQGSGSGGTGSLDDIFDVPVETSSSQ